MHNRVHSEAISRVLNCHNHNMRTGHHPSETTPTLANERLMERRHAI